MKKFLSVFLTVVLLFSVMSVCASADNGLSYDISADVQVPKTYVLDGNEIKVSISINENKICALNNATTEYTCTINSVKSPDGIDYYTNPEEFLKNYSGEDFNGSYISVDFTLDFASDLVFGELEYTISIDGFSAPYKTQDSSGLLDLVGGLIGGSTPEIDLGNVPTPALCNGVVDAFPSMNASSIVLEKHPVKNTYTDTEKFDPTGMELTLSLNNGKEGTVKYDENNAYAFSCVPSLNESLSVYDSEVALFFNGILVGYSPINVEHNWPADINGNGVLDEYVNITTDKYTENKPGYHAVVCEGCGETHDAQPHTPKYEEWTFNNDQSFVANGTESNECADCGTVLIRDKFGSADFNTTFGDMHFVKVIFEYINVLLRFIGAATY